MLFKRGTRAVDALDVTFTDLQRQSIRFVRACVELIARLKNVLTLFGEASKGVTAIKVALATIDTLLSLFRAAPGIGKIIQKVLDQVVSVVRRAIPPFDRVITRLNNAASLLNLTLVPFARELIKSNLFPLFRPVKRLTTDLLITLEPLEQQQPLLESILPPSLLAQIEGRIANLEALNRRGTAILVRLRAANDELEAKSAFLNRIYATLSVKKLVLDTVSAYLEEIGSAIQGALDAVGDIIPAIVKRFITALLDVIDTALDFVLQRLKDLLEWIGIDISGFLDWIQQKKDQLGQELAALLDFLAELENLVAPLEDLVTYLQNTVLALLNDATETARRVQEEATSLLALLRGLAPWKRVIELLLRESLAFVRLQLQRIEKGGTEAVPAARVGLPEFESATWGNALVPVAELPLLGDWVSLMADFRALLDDEATLQSANRRAEAVRALRERVDRIEATHRERFAKVIKRLPKDYFDKLQAVEAPLVVPIRELAEGTPRRRAEPKSDFQPSAGPLRKDLAASKRTRRPRARGSRELRRLASAIERAIAGPPPR